MSIPGISGDELLAWLDQTSDGWRRLFRERPDALDLPCDIRESNRVGELLQHIVAVELRYVERLIGSAETPYDDVPSNNVDLIYAVHDEAMFRLRQLSGCDEAWWQENLDFATRSGGILRASRRVMVVHLLTHSIRHYAQLATLVRHHDIRADWMMDYIGMAH